MYKHFIMALVLMAIITVGISLDNTIVSVLASFLLGVFMTIGIIEWATEFFMEDDGKEDDHE